MCDLVGNPEDRFSQDEAQITQNRLEYFRKMILVCFYGISLTSHRVIRSSETDGVSIFHDIIHNDSEVF